MIVKSVAYCSVRSLREDRVCILSLCVVVLTVRAGVGWNGPLVLAAPCMLLCARIMDNANLHITQYYSSSAILSAETFR